MSYFEEHDDMFSEPSKAEQIIEDAKAGTEYGNCGHPRQKGVLPSAYPFDFCSYGEPKKGK